MRIVFLSRYQNKYKRGVESFTTELVTRLRSYHEVEIFSEDKSDSVSEVLKGNFDVVIPLNGRWQSLKMSLFKRVGGYKILVSGHSGVGRDDIWNILIVR